MGIVKKTASIVASLIIILAIGGFVFVRNFDLNRYKSYIEDAAYQQTGRKLMLNGDAKIGLSLIPTLVINDVTLANPEWAQNPYMAKLEQLEIKFSLGALMHKKIDIKKFVLNRPEVFLEVSKDGQKSWEFAKLAAKGSGGKVGNVQSSQISAGTATAAIGFVADEVKLEDGRVTYYEAGKDITTEVLVKELELEAKGGNEPLKISVEAIYDGQNVELEAETSSLDKIMQSGDVEFSGKLKALKTQTVFNGTIGNITGDVKYSVEIDAHNPAGNFGAPETSLLARVDGDVTNADINVRSLNIANNLVAGSIKADWSKSKPQVNADLKSDVFDLNSLSKNSVLTGVKWQLIGEAQALEAVPNDKVPYQYLALADGAANLKIGKLIAPDDIVAQDMTVNAKLSGGVLNLSKAEAKIFGGNVAADGSVNAGKQTAVLNLRADNLRVADLYKTFRNDNNLQILSGGIMDVEVKAATGGATYRKWSENLDGQAVVLVNKSTMKTGKLDWLTDGVLGELFKLLKMDAATNTQLEVECAVVNAKLGKGKAEFDKGIAFSSDKLKVVGSGNINLVNDKIDFTVAPMMNKLASGNITQALASFIRLKGTLSSPSIGLDKTSALSTVVGSVATGGLYLGSEVLMSGDSNLCNTALQGTKFVARFPRQESATNDAKDVYQNVTGNTKEAIKGIGNTAKDLFKSLKSNLKSELKGK